MLRNPLTYVALAHALFGGLLLAQSSSYSVSFLPMLAWVAGTGVYFVATLLATSGADLFGGGIALAGSLGIGAAWFFSMSDLFGWSGPRTLQMVVFAAVALTCLAGAASGIGALVTRGDSTMDEFDDVDF